MNQDDNSTSQNPFWENVKSAVTLIPNQQQFDCQTPNPNLLNTGFAHFPHNWSPSTVDIQMLRVGEFIMLIRPGEQTTMASPGSAMRSARSSSRKTLLAATCTPSF